jgi:pentapeptide repeat protein
MIEIRNWRTNEVIYRSETATSVKEAVEQAVAARVSLRSADLRSADLESADLRSANLESANLESANLRSANLRSANLESADLYSANLRSADLESADLRSADLYSADLYSADLYSADLESANLRSADLRSANLRSADLYSADLRSADLYSADLYSANLRSADLRSANLPTHVVIPDIDVKIADAIAKPGCSLEMKEWHTCATTHCRAGWAIHLAGEAGRVLEDIYGPSAAGALIYAASRPDKPIPDFLASNEDAMRSILEDAGR